MRLNVDMLLAHLFAHFLAHRGVQPETRHDHGGEPRIRTAVSDPMLVSYIGCRHFGTRNRRRVESVLDEPIVVEHHFRIHAAGRRLREEHPLVQPVGARGGEGEQRCVIRQIDIVLMQVEREVLQ